MVYPIVKYPNPLLRKKCQEIKNPTDSSVGQLILDMVKTLRANKGLGLAAPQIGENVQLCVVELDNELFVLINPEIKKYYGREIAMEEGCLSFPGKYLPIKRYEKVKVKAIDTNGKKIIIRAKGLLSRAFQHEIDHLNGQLYIDRAETKIE